MKIYKEIVTLLIFLFIVRVYNLRCYESEDRYEGDANRRYMGTIYQEGVGTTHCFKLVAQEKRRKAKYLGGCMINSNYTEERIELGTRATYCCSTDFCYKSFLKSPMKLLLFSIVQLVYKLVN